MIVAQKPFSGAQGLVLAFDVGTTYSSVSYCILQPGQIPELRGVTRYPGQESGHSNNKVPSVLYYDANGNVRAAGSEALTMSVIHESIDKGWRKAEWWKLHLRPKYLASTHIQEDDIPPLPFAKSAVQVLTDFIKYLFECAKSYIQEHHPGFDWPSIENSIEFIFSHPNGWEGRQQQQYRAAIERAGLIPDTLEAQSRVHMINEGEASLHCCVSNLTDEFNNEEPRDIVIIDAGGGTIELSMYSMTFDPIACNEIAPAECRLHGSVFVTRRAVNLFKSRLEDSPHCSAEEIEVIAREFDQNTKLAICCANRPVYVNISTFRDNNNDPEYNVERGALQLSGDDVKYLFDESINAIIDAFEQQRKSVKTEAATMVFLVGGLGKNELLWTRLNSYFQAQGIQISRPDNDMTVANGAILFHINHEQQLVRSRVARIAYGVPYRVKVEKYNPEHRRRKDKWEWDVSGTYINGAFQPLLGKGEQINEQREIRHPFFGVKGILTDFNQFVDILCYRGDISNPQWTDEDLSSFSRLCRIWVDLSQAAMSSAAMKRGPSGKIYYKLDFDVVTLFGQTELTVQIAWKVNGQEERSPATIVYYDN